LRARGHGLWDPHEVSAAFVTAPRRVAPRRHPYSRATSVASLLLAGSIFPSTAVRRPMCCYRLGATAPQPLLDLFASVTWFTPASAADGLDYPLTLPVPSCLGSPTISPPLALYATAATASQHLNVWEPLRPYVWLHSVCRGCERLFSCQHWLWQPVAADQGTAHLQQLRHHTVASVRLQALDAGADRPVCAMAAHIAKGSCRTPASAARGGAA
jgi:hypothetical protein